MALYFHAPLLTVGLPCIRRECEALDAQASLDGWLSNRRGSGVLLAALLTLVFLASVLSSARRASVVGRMAFKLKRYKRAELQERAGFRLAAMDFNVIPVQAKGV